MPPRKLFGSLNLEGFIGRGENPNGMVSQTSNGTNINGAGSDGEDYIWGIPADGSRWNRTRGNMLEDRDVARPIAIVASRRRR
jgi:hypothetical protein